MSEQNRKEPRIDEGSVTVELPSEARRLRREAKAIKTIKNMTGESRREPPKFTFEMTRYPEPGEFVYFMYSNSLIKIGYTTDIYRRLNDMTNMGGAPVVLIGVIPGTVELERLLHHAFKPDRTHGEWFRISDDILGYLAVLDAAVGALMPPEAGSCLARLAQAQSNSPADQGR